MTTQQPDYLRPWARWLINHHMRWLLVAIAWLALPIHLLMYLPDAFREIRSEIRNIK